MNKLLPSKSWRQLTQEIIPKKVGILRYTFSALLLLTTTACTSNMLKHNSTGKPGNNYIACQAQSENYASTVCGNFERSVRSKSLQVEFDIKNDVENTIRLIDGYTYKGKVVGFRQNTEAYNVLREHLAGELQHTRECRQKIALLATDECVMHTCRDQCSFVRQKSLTTISQRPQKIYKCQVNKRNGCKVKCKLNTDTANEYRCNDTCSIAKNSHWKTSCEGRYPLESTSQIESEFNQCFSSCG